MVGVTGGGGNFWASENLSGRVHFEGYLPEWRVLSKLSVQPCFINLLGQIIEDYAKAACVEANKGHLHCHIKTSIMMYNQNF